MQQIILLPTKLYAQVLDFDDWFGSGNNPFADSASTPPTDAEGTVKKVVSSALMLGILFLFLIFIYVTVKIGLKFVQSGGNKQEYEGSVRSLRNLAVGAGVGILVLIVINLIFARYFG